MMGEETLRDRRRKRKEVEGGEATEGRKRRAKGKGVARAPDNEEDRNVREREEDMGEEEVLKILPGNWTVKEGDTLMTPGVVTQLADFIDLEGEAHEDVEGDVAEQIEVMLREEMKEMLQNLTIMRQWRQHMMITQEENERLRRSAADFGEKKAGLVAEVAALKLEAELKVAAAEAAEGEKRDMEEALKMMRQERDITKAAENKSMFLCRRAVEKRRESNAQWAVLLGQRENQIRAEVAVEAVDVYKESPSFKTDVEAYLAKRTFLFMERVANELRETVPELDVAQITALKPFWLWKRPERMPTRERR